MTPGLASEFVKGCAEEFGFDSCRVAQAGPIGRADYLEAWLARGAQGSMGYLGRNVESRRDPRELLDGARSVAVFALSYNQARPVADEASAKSTGQTAMYAWGDDYHRVIKKKLHALADRMRAEFGPDCQTRVCVDTAPIVERELAAAAGVGWIGKNTLVLNETLGSYFFLGEILTTTELEPDSAGVDHCGSCRACLDACPTDAFDAPYQMDASRCISYLTIEHRGDVPAQFHDLMGDWLFGCDVCQQVCPFNRDAAMTGEPRLFAKADRAQIGVDEIAQWDADLFQTRLRGSAMKRARLDMWKRNAAIVRANLERNGADKAADRD